MPRKRNPEAARIEKDYKSKRAKIKSGLRSASAGQASEIRGQSREGMTVVGSQKPDATAKSRYPRYKRTGSSHWVDDGSKYGTYEKDPSDKKRYGRTSGAKPKSRISKKKPKTEREYDAKKKLEKDKTPQDTPTFNTNPKGKAPKAAKGSRRRVQPKPATAKPEPATRKRIIGSTSTLKKPRNYVSPADRKLIEGNPKKKKRKAPTYRG